MKGGGACAGGKPVDKKKRKIEHEEVKQNKPNAPAMQAMHNGLSSRLQTENPFDEF